MGSQYAERTIEPGVYPVADAYAADPASDVVNMELFNRVHFLLIEGAGGTGTALLTVEECTALDGTGPVAIPFLYRIKAGAGAWGAWTAATASGYTTVAGASKMVEIAVRAEELSADSPFVRLQVVEVADSPVAAAVLIECFEPRYATEPPQQALV